MLVILLSQSTVVPRSLKDKVNLIHHLNNFHQVWYRRFHLLLFGIFDLFEPRSTLFLYTNIFCVQLDHLFWLRIRIIHVTILEKMNHIKGSHERIMWRIQAFCAKFDTKRMIFWTTRTHPSLIKRFTSQVLIKWFHRCHIRHARIRVSIRVCVFVGFLGGIIGINSVCYIYFITTWSPINFICVGVKRIFDMCLGIIVTRKCDIWISDIIIAGILFSFPSTFCFVKISE